jgi:branched-chain amino acid transport system substrate-binding protein
MGKRTLWIAALAMFSAPALCLSPCLGEEPVKIACHAAFTGKYSAYGMSTLHAVRYEVARKNREGGIKSLGGAKVELVEMDNATNAKDSVANHERLGTDGNVLAVVGPCPTPMSQPVEPIAAKYRLPTVHPITTLDKIFEHGNEYVFAVSVLASRFGATYARFMMEMHKKYGLSLNRVTVAYPDNDYGIGVADGFKEGMKAAGFEKNIVLDLPFNWESKDLSPVVLKIKAANPDFHLQVAYFADGKLYHDACYNLGFHPWQVGGAGGFNHPKLWTSLGEKIAEATIGSEKTFPYDMAALDLPNPGRDAWIKGFAAEKPDIAVEMDLLLGAMAGRFVMEAIEKAGKRDRTAIAKALHSLSLEKDDPRDLCGIFNKPGPVWMADGKPNSYGFMAQWEKMSGEWKKKTLFHPLTGMMAAPRAFR